MSETPNRHAWEERVLALEKEVAEWKRAAARFQSLYERVPLAYQSLNAKGALIEVNPAWLDLFGYRREEVIGRSFADFLPRPGRVRFRETFARLKSVGEASGIEHDMLKKGGTPIRVSIDGTVARDESGNFLQSHCILRDVTELRRATEALKETKTLLENVYASLDEAVLVVDPVTRVICSCNAAAERVLGYRKEELIGRNIRFIHVNEQSYREFAEKVFSTLDREGIFHTEFRLRKKNGGVFPSDHTVKEVRNEQGRRTMVVSVFRDMTTQKDTLKVLAEKEEKLRARTRRLEELNTALKVLLDQREQEKGDLEESFAESVSGMILPYVDRIKEIGLTDLQREYIHVLESNLKQIIKPHMQRLSGKLMHLSSAETRIVAYIRQGYQTKEIAESLNLSPRTVEFHRDNIRKKLGLKGRKINLRSYLAHIK